MSHPHRVVVLGGGIAGLEAALALRALASERLRVELVSDDHAFAYRPLAVAEPFGRRPALEVPLDEVAAERGLELHRAAVLEVDPLHKHVRTPNGELGYDTLVVALGARPVPAVPGALTFPGPDEQAVLEVLGADRADRIAFVVPAATTWAVPAYELALQTAVAVEEAGREADVALITAERAPLELFGLSAARAVAGRLAREGIVLHARDAVRTIHHGHVQTARGADVPADAVVALPRLRGPAVAGLPADPDGFLPVDADGRVPGAPDVYAIGDGAASPVKQGGLAVQQADRVAAVIAGTATGEAPAPVLRAMVLTGREALFLRRALDGQDEGVVSRESLWWPPTKVLGEHLTPLLAARAAAAR